MAHRDIKPANIFRATDGSWKLGDWGTVVSARGTNHLIAGTAPYMAPAAFRGQQGPVEDLYVLGVTIHEALTGRLLHDLPVAEAGEDVGRYFARCWSHVERVPPAIDPGLPEWWRSTIARMTSQAPDLTAARLHRQARSVGDAGGAGSRPVGGERPWAGRSSTVVMPGPPAWSPPRLGDLSRLRRPDWLRVPPGVGRRSVARLTAGWGPARRLVDASPPAAAFAVAASASVAGASAEWLSGAPVGRLADGGRNPFGPTWEHGTSIAAGWGALLLLACPVLALACAAVGFRAGARLAAVAAVAGGAWAVGWQALHLEWALTAAPLEQACIGFYALALIASFLAALR